MHYLDSLRSKRKAAKLKQRQVADAVGVNKEHVSRMETGARGASATTIVRLAILFGDDPVRALQQANVLEGKRRGSKAKCHLSAETRTHDSASDCVDSTRPAQGEQG